MDEILCSAQIETLSEGFVLIYEQTKIVPGKKQLEPRNRLLTALPNIECNS